MTLFWLTLTGVCIASGIFFVWRGNTDAAFVIASLGLVAWFLNYRAQLRKIIAEADRQEDSIEEDKE